MIRVEREEPLHLAGSRHQFGEVGQFGDGGVSVGRDREIAVGLLDGDGRVAVAEQTGNLAPGLRDISRSYRAELDRWLGTVSQTISASVLVAAFSFVAFIAFAIVAAVFEVSSSFRF